MIMLGRFVMTHTTAALVAMLTLSFATSTGFAQSLTMPPEPLSVPTDVIVNGGSSAPGLSLPTPTETPLGVETYSGPSAPSSAYSSGSGSVYNPTLGAHIRARYTSESYGQHSGNFDLGTMKLWNVDGGVAFFDGQVTLNDTSRVGYNLGLGYRWMTLPLFPNSPDDAKIMGVSVWADGQGADGENFFPQIGTSLEFLGDRIDFRANGYAVLGDSTQARDFLKTGEIGFTENNVAQLTLGTLDTALSVGEVEIAGRIMDLDAWLFGGVYSFAGDGISETGGKIGLRGYASPDLALSIAITHDDLFETNAVFGATWFIGRTRRENYPCGTLRDRMREPVIRNNYVSIARTKIAGTADIATDANGDAFRVVHVDSTAAAGGDGTFENPLNSLNDINGNSLDGDIVLGHADSVFSGQSAALRNDQTFVGEGGGNAFSITTTEFGTIDLPESTSGALNGAIPSINGSPSAGVVVALNNTVQNLAFDGGVNAIINDAAGSENATLRNLTIANTSGDGISLTTIDGADTEDLDGDSNTTEIINILGNVVIDQVSFTGVVGSDIAIDAASTAADNRGETIAISNITSTGNANVGGESIDIRNTNGTTGDSVTIDAFTFTGGNGGITLDSNKSNVSVTNSTITGGTGIGVDITNSLGVASTETISIGSTVEITNVAGTAVNIDRNQGAVTVNAAISTTGVNGGNVIVTKNEAQVIFGGDITTNNAANSILIDDSMAGVNFSGDIVSNGTGNTFNIKDAGENTTDASDVTVSGTVTNNATGSVVIVDGGNDVIAFNGTVTDNGAGIQISNRTAGPAAGDSKVEFTAETTLTGTGGTAVSLVNNDDDSTVDFTGKLDITRTTGVGIFASNGGELNVTGADSSITTTTNQALNITGGSSTNGVTFASVNVNGAANAIDLNNFDGTVTVNDGILTTTQEAVTVRDSGLVLNSVDIDAGNDEAIGARFTTDTLRLLSVTAMDANGGDFDFDADTTGQAIITLTDITEGGAVSFLSSSSNNNNLTLSNVETDDGFDYDVTGTGDLGITMTNVTGAGNTTFDVSSSGNANLNLTNVNTGGAITANSTAGSTGNMTVNVSNSGNTTAFTDITINNQGNGVVNADFSNTESTGVDFDTASTNAGSLTITDMDVNGGALDFASTGSGGATVLLTSITEGGAVAYASSGSGNSVLSLSNVTTNDAFDYDVTGAGNLDVNMTNVTGAGDTTLDITSTGNGSLTMSSVNTGGAILANSTAGSSGDMTVDVSNSGNTTAFTGITINDLGDGAASASLSNVTSTSGVDFDSTGNGTASLNVSGGEFGGEINANANNNSSFTANVTNNTELTAGGIDITAANTGAFNSNLNSVDTQEGVTINSTSVGNATIAISGGSYGDAFDIDTNNTGTLNFTMQNVVFDTTNNNTAVSLLVGTGVSTGGIDIFNNTGIITGDASALDIDFNGGDIDFRLNNNTFTNNSGTANTAAIDIAGTTTLDATVTNNTFVNSNVGGPAQFLIDTSANSPTLNLNIAANTLNSGGGTGNGELIIRETAGTISVFERDDTFNNVGNRNNGTVTFDPNVLGSFDDLASEPALP